MNAGWAGRRTGEMLAGRIIYRRLVKCIRAGAHTPRRCQACGVHR